MSLVVLASGGLDSSVIAAMATQEGESVFPLFIDYGQRAAEREWAACTTVCRLLRTKDPVRMDISGYGAVVESGLTTLTLDLARDAFLPGRNAILALAGAAYAKHIGVARVAIGLLREEDALFPDQTSAFIDEANSLIKCAIDPVLSLLAPLAQLTKGDVCILAEGLGLTGTYSCHAGNERPCGTCISCREIATATSEGGS